MSRIKSAGATSSQSRPQTGGRIHLLTVMTRLHGGHYVVRSIISAQFNQSPAANFRAMATVDDAGLVQHPDICRFG